MNRKLRVDFSNDGGEEETVRHWVCRAIEVADQFAAICADQFSATTTNTNAIKWHL
jgi:hypothetical protein